MTTISDSPFACLLNTNHVPSDDESTRLKVHLEQPRQLEAELNRRLGHLKLQLAALEHEREERHRYIEMHEALLTPARAVPEDVLCTVFQWCVVAVPAHPIFRQDEAVVGDIVDLKSCPFTLTHVCRRWRVTALSMRSLWTNPHIRYPSASSTLRFGIPTSPKLLELFVSRASDLPISMTITGGRLSHWVEENGLTTPLLVLAAGELASRYRSLSLCVMEPFVAETFSYLSPSRTPMLECLDIRCDERISSLPPSTPGAWAGKAIRAIGLTGMQGSRRALVDMPFDGSYLTELRISDRADGLHLIPILARCPQLRRLCANFTNQGAGNLEPSICGVVLPNLTAFTVSKLQPEPSFYSLVEMPNLQSLVCDDIVNSKWFSTCVEPFSLNLRHLGIRAYMIKEREMGNVLGLLDGLEGLEISDDIGPVQVMMRYGVNRGGMEAPLLTDSLLRLLTPGYRPPFPVRRRLAATPATPPGDRPGSQLEAEEGKLPQVLCPNLRDLELRVTEKSSGISDDAIFDFIQGRRSARGRGLAALRKVVVKQDWVRLKYDVVTALREEGVDIRGMLIHIQ